MRANPGYTARSQSELGCDGSSECAPSSQERRARQSGFTAFVTTENGPPPRAARLTIGLTIRPSAANSFEIKRKSEELVRPCKNLPAGYIPRPALNTPNPV